MNLKKKMGIRLRKAKNKSQESLAGTESSIERKEYEARLEFLYDVAQRASSAAEVYDLLKEIPAVIQKIVKARASSLFMIDDTQKILCLQAAGHDKSSMLKHIKLGLDTGVVGWVARNGQPVMVNDASEDRRFDKEVDEATGFVTKSIIAAPMKRRQKVIGVVEMINRVDGSPFTDRDLGLITEFASMEALTLLVSMAGTLINNFKQCQMLQDEYRSTIETLVTAADAKDPYAHGHSRRVREYTMMAARCLKLTPPELKLIEFGALLHDIGKIGIDDHILRKAGPLTAEEAYIIRKHALKGANIVGAIPNLEKATDLILYHHERFDGKGYPEGLKGEQIPLGARLIAVADAFDTMTTDHAYRDALSTEEAIGELIECGGTQFCPKAIKAFVAGFQKRQQKLAVREPRPGEEPVAAGPVREEIKEAGRDEADIKKMEKEARQAAREETKREGEVARTAREAEKLADREDGQAFREEARRDAEEAKRGKEAMKLAEKEAKKAARELAKQEAEAAKKDKEAMKLAEKEAKKAARELAKQESEDARSGKSNGRNFHVAGTELYEGSVELGITRIESFRQINQFRKSLLAVENLSMASDSWSEEEGFVIIVSAREPMPLGQVLREMPDVEEVTTNGEKIMVAFKVTEEAGQLQL
ncbi:MAG TPA: HD domain-containing phosphohydrolase [Dehalococcoidales bacterium]|nr:MAG: hypothetical protein A2Z05_08395 [Chloroflexi bacterium RBG_16_60_22]HJX11907.1 HD domain-containing phosphohydrolase [Dehalococcoidales bacterium]